MDATQFGTGAFAALASFWAALQTYLNAQKQKQLNEVSAKASENTAAAAVSGQLGSTVERLEKSLEEWRQRYDANDAQHCARYDKLHEEHQKSTERHELDRKHWHGKSDADNLVHLKLQEENATLKARTDLKPLIDVLASMRQDRAEDVVIRARMLEGVNVLSESVNRLHDRLDTIETKNETPH